MNLRRSSEKGFTLIELLIVVAILGILAAVVIPNVGRFLGRGQEEARRTEAQNIAAAVTAMMTENKISAIPVPYVSVGGAPDGGCTVAKGTRTMGRFPDFTSTTTNKLKDPNGALYVYPGDKVGYLLFGHDLTGNTSSVLVTNYINFDTATYCYAADADGTIHQYNEAGVEQTN